LYRSDRRQEISRLISGNGDSRYTTLAYGEVADLIGLVDRVFGAGVPGDRPH
jgi:hypothetical protein